MKTMKTIYILAATIVLQFNAVFASTAFNESANETNGTEISASNFLLMPVTPIVASFEDVVETNSAGINISLLSPAVPMVADFNDGAPSTEISLIDLAPVTPKEASFEDETGVKNEPSAMDLSPVTPDADFDDCV